MQFFCGVLMACATSLVLVAFHEFVYFVFFSFRVFSVVFACACHIFLSINSWACCQRRCR